MKILIYSLFIWLFYSCNNRNQDRVIIDSPKQEMLPKETLDSLCRRAINEGDFEAYHVLATEFFEQIKNYELYYYALIMANKYQCPEAYENLYIILNTSITINGIKMYSNDRLTEYFSKFYLLKAYELGYDNAKYSIHEAFGDDTIPPKSSFYLEKIEEEYRNMQTKDFNR
ncbi:hypothetical protein ACR78F_20710 [Sphingobacterium spiritivorum]|uniref:hypothetical protein n=1 Tax=Sphingobacterium spiritivorum TaxID=258 RepID=UPI003DA375C3